MLKLSTLSSIWDSALTQPEGVSPVTPVIRIEGSNLPVLAWRGSSINMQTKIRFYSVYKLPILMCGADTWSTTTFSNRRLNRRRWSVVSPAHILRIHRLCHQRGSQVQDRSTMNIQSLPIITPRRLRLPRLYRPNCPVTRMNACYHTSPGRHLKPKVKVGL